MQRKTRFSSQELTKAKMQLVCCMGLMMINSQAGLRMACCNPMFLEAHSQMNFCPNQTV